jgi:hypothetical protein
MDYLPISIPDRLGSQMTVCSGGKGTSWSLDAGVGQVHVRVCIKQTQPTLLLAMTHSHPQSYHSELVT